MMHSVTPATMHMRYRAAKSSFFFLTIPSTPYCSASFSFSRYSYFSICMSHRMKIATATATNISRMVMPRPPAMSSPMAKALCPPASSPYSDSAPSTISGTGDRTHRAAAAAIRPASLRTSPREPSASSTDTFRVKGAS